MEYFRLEETFKAHPLPHPFSWAGTPSTTPRLFQPVLEHFPTWAATASCPDLLLRAQPRAPPPLPYLENFAIGRQGIIQVAAAEAHDPVDSLAADPRHRGCQMDCVGKLHLLGVHVGPAGCQLPLHVGISQVLEGAVGHVPEEHLQPGVLPHLGGTQAMSFLGVELLPVSQ